MANLSPFPIFRAFDALGNPLAGGKLNTFEAGTTTPKATFTDHTGTVANTNPVILDSRGEARVWLEGDYAMSLLDSNDNVQWTVESIVGVGSGSGSPSPVTASEWLEQSDPPTFISPTQLSVPGDATAVYHVGRRLRSQVSGGVAYSTITASSFGAGITTITVENDSTPLDGGISTLSVGINSADNPSIYVDAVRGIAGISQVPTGTILMTGATTPDAGYVWCDGTAYDPTDPTYANLFARISTTWGGDGVTTFNVPNLNGRSPMGFGQGNTAEGGGLGTLRSIGDAVGAETHTLTTSQMPSHVHSGGVNSARIDNNENVGGREVWEAVDPTVDTGSTGGGDAHNNMAPVLVCGFQIKL